MKPTKPLPSNKMGGQLVKLLSEINDYGDVNLILKSLRKHRDAVVRQYNDPTHYYGPMLPSEMAMLRTDLAHDIHAFVFAITAIEAAREESSDAD
jgi:hypothetical protein